MEAATVVTVIEKLTLLVAAHGVYALSVIFIFYLLRRAYQNLQQAQTDEDRRYFRRAHAAVLAATFFLVAAASTVWWRSTVRRIVSFSTQQALQMFPRSAGHSRLPLRLRQ